MEPVFGSQPLLSGSAITRLFSVNDRLIQVRLHPFQKLVISNGQSAMSGRMFTSYYPLKQVWTLWNLPQANSYPDRTCPALSYQILGKQNTTIRCQPCSDCPPGRQLTPPCGSKIQQNAVIACTVCPSNAYKDSQGRGICLPCQKCSPKQTISPCLAWKNARCGPCPRGTYP